MRLSRIALLGTALAALAGCREDATDPTLAVIPDLAYIRYINAVPDTLNTTLRFIDHVQFVPQTFANVAFRGLGNGGYQGVRLDAHKIRIFTADASDWSVAGNTAVLVDTTLNFEKGKYYTLLHAGYARQGSTPKQRLVVIEDVHPTPGANLAVRFINTGVGLGAMDFYALATNTTPVAGAPAVANLAAGGVSAYITRTPAQFSGVATAPGATTAIAAGAAPAGIAGNPFVPAANGVPAVQPIDPVSGATVAGSVLTGFAFPASVTGSRAAASAAPTVVFYADKQPPRYTTP
ncbi:MAG: DUF4397 domain-containing protein [Gemmatimonas sp.]